jgi:FMN reductase
LTSDKPINLLAIGGSMREQSLTLMAMNAMLVTAQDHNIEPTVVSVRELDLPVFNDDLSDEEHPQALHDLSDQVKAADAFLICSPTYHGSMSGAMKNVLDSLHIQTGQPDAFFRQCPVALAAYGGPTSINVVNTLQTVVRTMKGMIVPTVLTVTRDGLDHATGLITTESTRTRADTMLGEIADHVRRHRTAEAGAAAV